MIGLALSFAILAVFFTITVLNGAPVWLCLIFFVVCMILLTVIYISRLPEVSGVEGNN